MFCRKCLQGYHLGECNSADNTGISEDIQHITDPIRAAQVSHQVNIFTKDFGNVEFSQSPHLFQPILVKMKKKRKIKIIEKLMFEK